MMLLVSMVILHGHGHFFSGGGGGSALLIWARCFSKFFILWNFGKHLGKRLEDTTFSQGRFNRFDSKQLRLHITAQSFQLIHPRLEEKNDLPAVNVLSRHQEPGASLLPTDINSLSVSANIRVPGFNYVRLIYDNIGINISRIDPVASEILRQVTTRNNNFIFH